MSRPRGGIIGKRVAPGVSMSGIWTLREYQEQVAAQEWPQFYDADYTSVSLLLHMDGANNSTTFIDSGPGDRTVTANGDAKISTAQSKFGGASAVFDGTGDFLSVANNAAFDFGSGDMAIESWIYISANSSQDADGNRGFGICNTWNISGNLEGWLFGVTGNSTTTGTGFQLDSWVSGGNGTLFRATESIAHSVWHHVVASVSGGVRRLYLNGTQLTDTTTLTVGSGYTPLNSQGFGLRIANTQRSDYPLAMNGYIDELRITKGTARGYTGATIPVPTVPFGDK